MMPPAGPGPTRYPTRRFSQNWTGRRTLHDPEPDIRGHDATPTEAGANVIEHQIDLRMPEPARADPDSLERR